MTNYSLGAEFKLSLFFFNHTVVECAASFIIWVRLVSPVSGVTGGSGNLSTSLSNVARLAAHPKFEWVFNAGFDETIICIMTCIYKLHKINGDIFYRSQNKSSNKQCGIDGKNNKSRGAPRLGTWSIPVQFLYSRSAWISKNEYDVECWRHRDICPNRVFPKPATVEADIKFF
jgi:hypothetical protein